MTTEEQQLVERLRAACVGHPHAKIAAWPHRLLHEAADTITRLVEERDRCHARLEIDHYWRIGDNDDADLERVEIPLDERSDFPDGIAARDATIALADEDRTSLEAKVAELQEALKSIDGMAKQAEVYATGRPSARLSATDVFGLISERAASALEASK